MFLPVVARTCSQVERTYVTVMPVIATLAMAENHIKTNSITLHLQAECWYEQEKLPQAYFSPFLPLQSEQDRFTFTFLTFKTTVRKTRKKTVRRGSPCLDKPMDGVTLAVSRADQNKMIRHMHHIIILI